MGHCGGLRPVCAAGAPVRKRSACIRVGFRVRALPPPVLIALDRPERYPLPPLPPTERRCSGKLEPLVEKRAGYGFTFDDVPIRPIPSGPRIREQQRESYARKWLSTAVATRELKDCFRWARHDDPMWEGTMTARLLVDELGRTERVEDVSMAPPFAHLSSCVLDFLRLSHHPVIVPRRTEVALTIQFRRSGQGKPTSRPKRPPAPKVAPRAGVCLSVPASPTVDRLAAELAIDDFDESQAAHEKEADWQRDHRAWEHGGRRGPEPIRQPVVRMSGPHPVSSRVSPLEVGRSFESNRGAFQRCYADAFARRPGLSGRVELRIIYDGGGSVEDARVTTSTASAPELEACLLAAGREVWIEPSHEDFAGQLTVDYPLTLVPTPATLFAPPSPPSLDAVDAHARMLLEAGWSEAALNVFGALHEQGGEDARRCQWHMGAVAAARRVAPWVDARVRLAVFELVDHLGATMQAPETQACLVDAVKLLERHFLDPYERGRENTHGVRIADREHLMEVATARYRELLQRGPLLAGLVRRPADLPEQ